MSKKLTLTVGDIVDKMRMLEVACTKCERKGRLNVQRLAKERGLDQCLVILKREISSDCPRQNAVPVSIYDLCGAHYPELAQVFSSKEGDGKPR